MSTETHPGMVSYSTMLAELSTNRKVMFNAYFGPLAQIFANDSVVDLEQAYTEINHAFEKGIDGVLDHLNGLSIIADEKRYIQLLPNIPTLQELLIHVNKQVANSVRRISIVDNGNYIETVRTEGLLMLYTTMRARYVMVYKNWEIVNLQNRIASFKIMEALLPFTMAQVNKQNKLLEFSFEGKPTKFNLDDVPQKQLATFLSNISVLNDFDKQAKIVV